MTSKHYVVRPTLFVLIIDDRRGLNTYTDQTNNAKLYENTCILLHCEHHEVSSTVASVTAGKSLGLNGLSSLNGWIDSLELDSCYQCYPVDCIISS